MAGEVTREGGTEVEANGGGGTTGDRCVECEDPRLEIDLGAAGTGTDSRCGCSGSESDEESVSSCCTVPLDREAIRGGEGRPIGGTVHSIKCEGRVSNIMGRGPASGTT